MKTIHDLCPTSTAAGAAMRRAHLVQCLVVGLMVLVINGPTVALAEQSPTDHVKGTITEVFRILDQEELRRPGSAVERRQQIERVLRQRVNYEEMAKRALGPTWSQLTVLERREFVGLFVQLLRDQFAGKIDIYDDEQVQYLSEQREANMAEVRTVITGAKTMTRLDFRLADRTGEWLVYDVVIDGASIVSNYRAQFASIMRNSSYVNLVERMKEKTLVVKAFEQDTRRDE
jgi:phospholipid transport system substrate-binding protein